MRLIDADEVMSQCREYAKLLKYDGSTEREWALVKRVMQVIDQQPTVTADPDTISRQAVLDAVLNLNVENRVSWRDAVIDTIDAMPSSPTPNRPKGQWILKEKGIKASIYECPLCGRGVIDDTGYDPSVAYPFCHCGADMQGGAVHE